MNTLATLEVAINNRQQISFEYNKEGKERGIRYGNPYAVFIFTDKTGNKSTKVHIVQTGGVSESSDTNPFPSFRMCNIENLVNVQILSDRPSFSEPYHEKYNPDWEQYKDVIAKI